jgi:hypothetical protein
VLTFAALRRKQRDHVVSDREIPDLWPERLDHARALMAEHRRRVARRIDSRGGVHVGVADATGHQPYQDLPALGLCQVQLSDVQRLPELLKYSGTNLHIRSLTVWP